MIKLEVVKGDIVDSEVDVIVTAANQGLRGGGGVDGAVHRACGSGLLEECKELEGCSTGKAKITRSYDLESQGVGWVIHAVGPRYAGGMYFEADLLADVYEAALKLTVTYSVSYEEQCLEVLDKYIGHLEPSQKKPYQRDAIEDVREYVKDYPIKSIALPSISTGLYAYPLEEAARIAVKTIKRFISQHDHLDKILLVCDDIITYNVYKKLI